MGVNYKPLWIQLIQRNMTKTDLMRMADLTTNVIANMGKNEYISLRNLEKVCRVLKCTPNDVVEFEYEGAVENEQPI